ncbi:FG-GAP repeat domain-containing protein [Sanyastnella coralliicola]|uniref:FG-GAP repeat domain-containing protein n=1 Tax=Sanyastnella coralliicola TaxID=3069118 RepID=UPI0027B9EB8A|nr:VCBS repeat-containing protein [Longitalea sp. SCSIO 12813]
MPSTKLIALFLAFCLPLVASGQFDDEAYIDTNQGYGNNEVIDLDGDGDLDILLSQSRTNTIIWHENLGNGEFSSKQVLVNLETAMDVKAGDMDGDGDFDLIGSAWQGELMYFENLGEIQFAEGVLLHDEQNNYASVRLADLDQDGDLDVIKGAGNWFEGVSWFENSGDGTFSESIPILSGSYNIRDIQVADLDGDSDLDVVFAGYYSHTLGWLENLGGEVFSELQVVSYNESHFYNTVLAEDLNGDGVLELIASTNFSDHIFLFEIQDNDLFDFGSFGYGNGLIATTAFDFDGDNDIDVLASKDDEIVWYENLGGTEFSEEQTFSQTAHGPYDFGHGDFNGDGYDDLLWYGDWANASGWVENLVGVDLGSNHFLYRGTEGPVGTGFGDFDGDGDLDVAAFSSNRRTTWYENLGDEQFSEEIVILDYSELGYVNVESMFSEDFDGDGDPDLVVFGGPETTFTLLENDGNAQFTEIPFGYYIPGVRSSKTIDIDGDGDLDIYGLSTVDNNDLVFYCLNEGNGVFSLETFVNISSSQTKDVIVFDLDNDGDLDIITSNSEEEIILYFENLGDYNFQEAVTILENYPINNIAEGDLDNDGLSDLIIPMTASMQIHWKRNLGNGMFSDLVQIVDILYVQEDADISPTDLDNDGDLDLLMLTEYSSDRGIAWCENIGDGSMIFGSQMSLGNTYEGWMDVEDLDNDGFLDVLFCAKKYDELVWYRNLFGQGCTDNAACNYNELSTEEDGSCCYDTCGCTDEEAENYNPEAICSDGSCSYSIAGSVFFDANSNGYWEDYEIPLANREIVISPQQIIAYTNDEGHYFVDGLNEGQFNVSHVMTDEFPFATTPNPINWNNVNQPWNFSENNGVFGVSDLAPLNDISVYLYPDANTYPCDDWVTHHIVFTNEGNNEISGQISLVFDELFQDYIEVSPLESANDNVLIWTFENLLPGHTESVEVELKTPTVDFIGEVLVSEVSIFGFYFWELVAQGESTLVQELTCAYDPNDKQAFPLGYSEDHLMLNGTELDYLIRFQNTGNAPATDVLVTDTVSEYLDLTSFELIDATHSVMVSIDPDQRVIKFFFENIMLPDSLNDEPNSHGHFLFKIKPLDDLQPGTVIYNEANIFFDNNPPIITNTTWNTIHECGGEAEFSLDSEAYCTGVHIDFEATHPYIEDVSWSLDVVSISTAVSDDFFVSDQGEYELFLVASNPLCEASSSQIIEVENLSDAPPCIGDFDCNGQRSTNDLILFLSGYGCSGDCQFDIDGNGITSVEDLIVFLSVFGIDCFE